jgi:hypothetical protein
LLSCRFPPVTISAANFALTNLVGKPFPTGDSTKQIANISRFVTSDVIEIQYHRIGLSTVYARVFRKIFANPLYVTSSSLGFQPYITSDIVTSPRLICHLPLLADATLTSGMTSLFEPIFPVKLI